MPLTRTLLWPLLLAATARAGTDTVSAFHRHDIQDVLPGVLAKAGTPTKYYVEFGYNKPSWQPHANVGPLKAQGWTGLLLDIANHNPSINLHKAFISSKTIVPLFRNHSVPREPDYVSIDIDSADVWVLDAMLQEYKPRVLSVEFNCNYAMDGFGSPAFPDTSFMPFRHSNKYGQAFHWGRGGIGAVCYFGSSSRAVMKAAEYAGYVTVDVACTIPTGMLLKISHKPFCTDLILVRKDLLTWTVDTDALHAKLRPIKLHQPMSPEMAENLVDYETYKATKSVCKARAAAAVHLRNYARTTNYSCFRLLGDLEPAADCIDA